MNKPDWYNKLDVCNFDRHHSYGTDWVTESTYITDVSLTKEEFIDIIEKHHEMYGSITFRKYRLHDKNGKVYYKHVAEEVMY